MANDTHRVLTQPLAATASRLAEGEPRRRRLLLGQTVPAKGDPFDSAGGANRRNLGSEEGSLFIYDYLCLHVYVIVCRYIYNVFVYNCL